MKTIVKYSNRKMYDKELRSYITFKQLLAMPLGSFVVVEKETKKDITLDTLLSFLANAPTTESFDNSLKIGVMKYCIEQLSTKEVSV